MPEEIEYPVSFENLLQIVSGVHERSLTMSLISIVARNPERYGIDTPSVEVPEFDIKRNPTSNLVRFLVDFGVAWKYLNKDHRNKTLDSLKKLYEYIRNPFTIEDVNLKEEHISAIAKRMKEFTITNELAHAVTLFTNQTGQTVIPRYRELEDQVTVRDDSIFIDVESYDREFLKGSIEDRVRQVQTENSGIVQAFKETNKGFRTVENRIDSLALMWTTEVSDTREEIKKMQVQVEENRLAVERGKRAWKVMEALEGKEIKEYDERIDKLLKKYETIEENMTRWNRDWDYRRELGFLKRLRIAREYQDGMRELEEKYNKEKEKDDKKFREMEKEWEWWDAYFAADFKKMGYRYLPVWCWNRPHGIIREEYRHFMKGEDIKYRRLIISLLSLITYFSVSVISGIKLAIWSWKYLNEEFLERLRIAIEDYNNTRKEDSNSWVRNKFLRVLAGLLIMIVVGYMSKRGYGYLLGKNKENIGEIIGENNNDEEIENGVNSDRVD